jgi:hypothetical protein
LNKVHAERKYGLLKGQIQMADDFDAPLPDDIQAGFEGVHQATTPTPEEQAWLDMAPVGREFGSPDYERLMVEDAARYAQDDCTRSEEGMANVHEGEKPMPQNGKLFCEPTLTPLDDLVKKTK